MPKNPHFTPVKLVLIPAALLAISVPVVFVVVSALKGDYEWTSKLVLSTVKNITELSAQLSDALDDTSAGLGLPASSLLENAARVQELVYTTSSAADKINMVNYKTFDNTMSGDIVAALTKLVTTEENLFSNLTSSYGVFKQSGYAGPINSALLGFPSASVKLFLSLTKLIPKRKSDIDHQWHYFNSSLAHATQIYSSTSDVVVVSW